MPTSNAIAEGFQPVKAHKNESEELNEHRNIGLSSSSELLLKTNKNMAANISFPKEFVYRCAKVRAKKWQLICLIQVTHLVSASNYRCLSHRTTRVRVCDFQVLRRSLRLTFGKMILRLLQAQNDFLFGLQVLFIEMTKALMQGH